VLILIANVAGAFQSLFQEQCVQAEVAYVPTVLICTRSRFSQAGFLTPVDDRKTKPGKKDDKAVKSADDKTGRVLEVTCIH